MSASQHRSLVGTICRGELQRLIRDRRAFLMAVVLPVLLFPLMFLFMPKLTSMAEESLDEEETTVWVALDTLDPALEELVLERLEASEEPILIRQEPDFRGVAWNALGLEAIDTEEFEEDCDALLVARADGLGLDLVVHGSRTRSGAARGRVRSALNELIDERRAQGIVDTLGADPGDPFEFEEVDLAPPDDTLGLAVGKLLPLLAVFLILSAGSFAALDAFAGERESGTLETLLVQPVPSLQLAWGKFLCVATIAGIAFIANAVGLFACAILGLGDFGEVQGAGLPLGRIVAALLVYVPTVLLLSALLTWISARARSFREGQNFLLPLTLVVIAPAALATQDSVELDYLIGAIPIAGASLAMRDALTGALTLPLAGWTILCSMVFAALSLRSVASALDAERVLSARSPGADANAGVRFGRALAWGFACALAVYMLGGWMQSMQLVRGLAATLWILVPALALLIALDLKRRTGEPLMRTLLGPRRPHPAHLLAGVLCAPLLAFLALQYGQWQGTWLPLPEMGSGLGLDELSLGWSLLLFAASPAIFEELLFRGSILRSMGGESSAKGRRRIIIWQVILFALVHASIHRFVPTGILGGLAAMIALASGSTIPAMLFHGTYNGLLIGLEGDLPKSWLPAMIGAAILGIGLLRLGRNGRQA